MGVILEEALGEVFHSTAIHGGDMLDAINIVSYAKIASVDLRSKSSQSSLRRTSLAAFVLVKKPEYVFAQTLTCALNGVGPSSQKSDAVERQDDRPTRLLSLQ